MSELARTIVRVGDRKIRRGQACKCSQPGARNADWKCLGCGERVWSASKSCDYKGCNATLRFAGRHHCRACGGHFCNAHSVAAIFPQIGPGEAWGCVGCVPVSNGAFRWAASIAVADKVRRCQFAVLPHTVVSEGPKPIVLVLERSEIRRTSNIISIASDLKLSSEIVLTFATSANDAESFMAELPTGTSAHGEVEGRTARDNIGVGATWRRAELRRSPSFGAHGAATHTLVRFLDGDDPIDRAVQLSWVPDPLQQLQGSAAARYLWLALARGAAARRLPDVVTETFVVANDRDAAMAGCVRVLSAASTNPTRPVLDELAIRGAGMQGNALVAYMAFAVFAVREYHRHVTLVLGEKCTDDDVIYSAVGITRNTLQVTSEGRPTICPAPMPFAHGHIYGSSLLAPSPFVESFRWGKRDGPRMKLACVEAPGLAALLVVMAGGCLERQRGPAAWLPQTGRLSYDDDGPRFSTSGQLPKATADLVARLADPDFRARGVFLSNECVSHPFFAGVDWGRVAVGEWPFAVDPPEWPPLPVSVSAAPVQEGGAAVWHDDTWGATVLDDASI